MKNKTLGYREDYGGFCAQRLLNTLFPAWMFYTTRKNSTSSTRWRQPFSDRL